MTYKFVGAIRGLGDLPVHQLVALEVGFALGLFIEVLRKLLRASRRYTAFVARPGLGAAVGWIADAVLLPSPYAYAFGTFVELPTALWWGGGRHPLLGVEHPGPERGGPQTVPRPTSCRPTCPPPRWSAAG